MDQDSEGNEENSNDFQSCHVVAVVVMCYPHFGHKWRYLGLVDMLQYRYLYRTFLCFF